MAKLTGTAPNQVPTNADLGEMAYKNSPLDVYGSDPVNKPVGYTYYNSTDQAIKVYLGDDSWGDVSVAPQATFEFALPNNPTYVSGTLSADKTVFTAQSNLTRNYSSVIVNWLFQNDFEVIVSWQHDYMGAGIAYGSNASLSDFTGQSTGDSAGTYWGSISVTGLNPTSNYGYFGQYHAPISGQGGGTSGTKHYFKMSRSGNTLSAQYSTSSASGPWSYFSGISTTTISSTDKCIVGFGEASQSENDPLRLLSITGS